MVQLGVGLCRWLALMISIITVFLLYAGSFYLTPAVRISLVGVFSLTAFISLFCWVLVPLYRLLAQPNSPDFNTIAKKVGRHFNQVDDRLANALQLYQKRTANPENYSLSLIEASLQDVGERLQRRSFRDCIDFVPIRRLGRRVAVVAALAGFLLLLFPSFFSAAAQRLSHPQRDFSPFADLFWQVFPGDCTIIKGQDLPIRIWLSKPEIDSIELLEARSFKSRTIPLQRAVDDTFRYTFLGIEDTLSYAIRAADAQSRAYAVRVLAYPVLRRLQIKIAPPAYSGLAPSLLPENIGDITALRGSRISLSASADKPLQAAEIRFDDTRQSAATNGKTVQTVFTVENDDRYSLILTDVDSLQTPDPIVYQINCLPDHVPLVQIEQPDRDIELPEDQRIAVIFQAQDDYGFSRISLATRVQRAGDSEDDEDGPFDFRDLSHAPLDEREFRYQLVLDAQPFELFPKDRLLYYIQVWDNDRISGPKSARSAIFQARFPSLYELYRDVADEHDDLSGQMVELSSRAEDLQQKMDELTWELYRQPENLDWQKRQQVEELLAEQEQLYRDLEQSAQDLQTLQDQLQSNQLVSEETLQKYQALGELMQELLSAELKEAMKELSEAMRSFDPQKMVAALKEMRNNEQELQENLDRLIALMENLRLQKALDQGMTLAKAAQTQQEAIESSVADHAGQMSALQREQAMVADISQQLQDVLQELDRNTEETWNDAHADIHAAAEQMRGERLPEKFQQMKELLANQQTGPFQQQSQQARQTLAQIGEKLSAAKQKISAQQQQVNMQAMQMLASDLLRLSHRQEDLLQKTQQLTSSDPRATELASEQNDLSAALGRLRQRAQDAAKLQLALHPGSMREMGTAFQNMQTARQFLTERQTQSANGKQAAALAGLNHLLFDLQQQMDQMMQNRGAGGMSFEQFMQQMQQAAQMQQGINQESLALAQGLQQALAQRQAMSRLAESQGRVRKSMQKLSQESTELTGALGDLDQLAEEMGQVENDLRQNRITPEMLEKQNRILSRMLDTQKSLQREDFSRQRQAESGKYYPKASPPALRSEQIDQVHALQQDLLRAKAEGYSKEVLDLIHAYFKLLMQRADEEGR